MRRTSLTLKRSPSRRVFAFRLRTLFVLVAILSLPLGWVGHSLNWIRQRERFYSDRTWNPNLKANITRREDVRPAPALLWLFGAQGRSHLWLKGSGDLEAAKRLFPEAIPWGARYPKEEDVPGGLTAPHTVLRY